MNTENQKRYVLLDVNHDAKQVYFDTTQDSGWLNDILSEKMKYGGYFRPSTWKFYKSIKPKYMNMGDLASLKLYYQGSVIRSCYFGEFEKIQDVLESGVKDYPWLLEKLGDGDGSYSMALQLGLFRTRHGAEGFVEICTCEISNTNVVEVFCGYIKYGDERGDELFHWYGTASKSLYGLCTTRDGYAHIMEEIEQKYAGRNIVKYGEETAFEIIDLMEAQAEARQAEAQEIEEGDSFDNYGIEEYQEAA